MTNEYKNLLFVSISQEESLRPLWLVYVRKKQCTIIKKFYKIGNFTVIKKRDIYIQTSPFFILV